MKPIIFCILMFVVVSSYSQSTQNSKLVLLKVTVTDFSDKPSEGDKLYFVAKKDGKEYTGVSNSTGYFELNVPRGDTYQIKIKSFDDNTDYCAVDVSADEKMVSYQILVKYQLPTSIVLKDINFDSGKATLKSTSYKALNELAEFMLLKKTLEIELSGHTDNTGDAALNLKLSEQRAIAVKNYLVSKGVNTNRIKAVGYGDTKPIASNDTDEGKLQNRRTEINVTKE